MVYLINKTNMAYAHQQYLDFLITEISFELRLETIFFNVNDLRSYIMPLEQKRMKGLKILLTLKKLFQLDRIYPLSTGLSLTHIMTSFQLA